MAAYNLRQSLRSSPIEFLYSTENQAVIWNYISRAGLLAALALLVAWALAHVECTTTVPAPVMLAMELGGAGQHRSRW